MAGVAGPEEPTRNLSAEVTRDLRAGAARPGRPEEPTRDLRRDDLRRLRAAGPRPPVPIPSTGPPPARFPAVPGRPPGRSAGRVVLVAAAALVGLVFLGVAGVGLYALVGPAVGGAATVELTADSCVRVTAAGGGGVDVQPAECGGPAADFRVVGTGAGPAECPADVDLTYGRTAGETVCLDVDWAAGDCFELSGTYPLRVDCAAPPGRRTVRVAEVDRTTGETAHCPTSSGLPYPQRRFVVCLDQL